LFPSLKAPVSLAPKDASFQAVATSVAPVSARRPLSVQSAGKHCAPPRWTPGLVAQTLFGVHVFVFVIDIRWVLLISFARFRSNLRGQIVSDRRSYAGITTE
jgi:hypothetical protein